MKILVISNLYTPHEIGGYETRCRDMVDHFLKRGHEVRVLTSVHRVAGRSEIDMPYVARKLRIHGMYGHPWLPLHQLYRLECENHQVVEQELADFRPDVIHVWNMGGISKSLLLRLEAAGHPVAYVISDHWIARSLRADVWLSWWNGERSFATKVMRQLLTWTGVRAWISKRVPTSSWDQLKWERVTFCSAFLRDFTAARGWRVEQGAVIPCGIRTGTFAVKQDYSSFQKLMWVGRLAEDKDPLTAVRAMTLSKHSALTLDLYGKGEDEYVNRLKQEIARLGLSDRVFLKSATESEIRHLYAEYDALLFTSNWGEPFALTPLEAMSAGLPVITSLDGGQAELARDRENCLVAAAAQPETYARCVDELAESEELRRELGRIELQEARERYDCEVVFQQMERFLLP